MASWSSINASLIFAIYAKKPVMSLIASKTRPPTMTKRSMSVLGEKNVSDLFLQEESRNVWFPPVGGGSRGSSLSRPPCSIPSVRLMLFLLLPFRPNVCTSATHSPSSLS